MRKLFVCLIASVLAAPSASAGISSVTGSLEVAIGTLPAASFTGGAPAASSAGAGGAATLPAGSLSGLFQTDVDPPLLTIIDGIGVAAPSLGSVPFSNALPATNNPLSFNGTNGAMSLNASAYLLQGGNVIFEIPLGVVGVGGTGMAHVSSLVAIEIIGNPYQLGMVTLMGGLNGTVHTVVGTGVDDRTASGKGTLVLVSPTMVNMGVLGSLASISTLTLEYVPEPGTLALLGIGLAGLAAVRGRKA